MKQPWIGKPLVDILFILLPPFLCLLIIAIFPGLFQDSTELSDVGWIILILLIDVAHVYSTLYRTYFDPVALKKQKTILFLIPFISFIAGVLLYSVDALLFWRVLAYIAIFHFIRQQYGFMRVYNRKEVQSKLVRSIDTITIYYATLYPIIFWHLSGPRNFNWFLEHDLFYFHSPFILAASTILYYLVIAAYILREIYSAVKARAINIPRFSIIVGTILSWYFGIVYFNGDMAFTLLNVVSHGIPYMALIWLYGNRNYVKSAKGNKFLGVLFSKYGIPIFLGLVFLFSFIEEGLWDIAVWKEHGNIFGSINNAAISIPSDILAFVVPLLALPQLTHYILDGFIWKIRQNEFKWSNETGKELKS